MRNASKLNLQRFGLFRFFCKDGRFVISLIIFELFDDMIYNSFINNNNNNKGK